MDERPLGYLITWTCYGARLHGDERGTVDIAHNQPGRPQLQSNQLRQEFERARMLQEPFLLTRARRNVVGEAIRETAEIKSWRLICSNIRTNHVHIVLDAPTDPGLAMNWLKTWATRRMREAGVAAIDSRVWTEGGSTRYLWTPEAVEAASRYVLFEQGPALD